MERPRAAVHRTIVVVDVERFGDRRRTTPDRLAVRDGLYRALRHAFDSAGLSWVECDHEDRGDGVFLLAPAHVPKAIFVNSVPRALAAALSEYNATHPVEQRIRLRMAVHAGEVTYDEYGVTAASINLTFRLLDALPLKAALAESPGVLAVITSGWFFDEVVRHSPDVDAGTYRPVRVAVKETTTVGWTCLPDHPYPSDATVLTAPPEQSARPVRIGVVPMLANCFQIRAALEAVRHAGTQRQTAVLIQAMVQPGARVLSGMGGVGKTQVAARYAEDQWVTGAVELLVWVTATSREQIITGYADTATRVLGANETDPQHAAQQLLAWLASTTQVWLIVLDDLQDPSDLAGLWPPNTPSGQVVVTTRRRDAALIHTDRAIIEIDVFTAAESLTYLHDVLAAHPHLTDGAAELAQDLGHLPLALAQAVAYLIDRDLTCRAYHVRLADRRKTLTDVFPERGELPDDHRDTVAATWSLSIDRADRLSPHGLARSLLQVAALLDPNGIPGELFATPAVLTHLEEFLGRPVDADNAWDALRNTHRLNLITVDRTQPERAVRIHALVQRATRETIPDTQLPNIARVCADALLQAWPAVERDSNVAQALRSNADTLHATAGKHLWESGCHPVLFRAGQSLGQAALLTAAVSYHEHLCATATSHLGPDHPDTLTARYELASWQVEAAEEHDNLAALYENLLIDQQRVLGPDHPDSLATRASIAHCLGAVDRAAATAIVEEMLPELRRILGPDHPQTLQARLDLARWQRQTGNFVAAAAALEQLLTDQRRLLGPDHPGLTKTRYNLALCRGQLGDPAAAVTALEELLADQLRIFGPNRPVWPLNIRARIAHWRGEAGDPIAAVHALEELLIDHLRVLGSGHFDTRTVQSALAYWRERAAPQRENAQR